MRAATVAFALCLLVHMREGNASLLFFPKVGDLDFDPTANSPSSTASVPSETTAAPTSSDASPTPAPGEDSTTPSAPPKPHCTVIVVTLDVSKLLSDLAPKFPFDAIENMLRPMAPWPFMDMRSAQNIPLQNTLDSVKKILDDAIQVPKDLVNTGESALGDLLGTLRGL